MYKFRKNNRGSNTGSQRTESLPDLREKHQSFLPQQHGNQNSPKQQPFTKEQEQYVDSQNLFNYKDNYGEDLSGYDADVSKNMSRGKLNDTTDSDKSPPMRKNVRPREDEAELETSIIQDTDEPIDQPAEASNAGYDSTSTSDEDEEPYAFIRRHSMEKYEMDQNLRFNSGLSAKETIVSKDEWDKEKSFSNDGWAQGKSISMDESAKEKSFSTNSPNRQNVKLSFTSYLPENESDGVEELDYSSYFDGRPDSADEEESPPNRPSEEEVDLESSVDQPAEPLKAGDGSTSESELDYEEAGNSRDMLKDSMENFGKDQNSSSNSRFASNQRSLEQLKEQLSYTEEPVDTQIGGNANNAARSPTKIDHPQTEPTEAMKVTKPATNIIKTSSSKSARPGFTRSLRKRKSTIIRKLEILDENDRGINDPIETENRIRNLMTSLSDTKQTGSKIKTMDDIDPYQPETSGLVGDQSSRYSLNPFSFSGHSLLSNSGASELDQSFLGNTSNREDNRDEFNDTTFDQETPAVENVLVSRRSIHDAKERINARDRQYIELMNSYSGKETISGKEDGKAARNPVKVWLMDKIVSPKKGPNFEDLNESIFNPNEDEEDNEDAAWASEWTSSRLGIEEKNLDESGVINEPENEFEDPKMYREQDALFGTEADDEDVIDNFNTSSHPAGKGSNRNLFEENVDDERHDEEPVKVKGRRKKSASSKSVKREPWTLDQLIETHRRKKWEKRFQPPSPMPKPKPDSPYRKIKTFVQVDYRPINIMAGTLNDLGFPKMTIERVMVEEMDWFWEKIVDDKNKQPQPQQEDKDGGSSETPIDVYIRDPSTIMAEDFKEIIPQCHAMLNHMAEVYSQIGHYFNVENLFGMESRLKNGIVAVLRLINLYRNYLEPAGTPGAWNGLEDEEKGEAIDQAQKSMADSWFGFIVRYKFLIVNDMQTDLRIYLRNFNERLNIKILETHKCLQKQRLRMNAAFEKCRIMVLSDPTFRKHRLAYNHIGKLMNFSDFYVHVQNVYRLCNVYNDAYLRIIHGAIPLDEDVNEGSDLNCLDDDKDYSLL